MGPPSGHPGRDKQGPAQLSDLAPVHNKRKCCHNDCTVDSAPVYSER